MEKRGEIPFLVSVWICAAALQSFTQNWTKGFQENSLHCWCNELAKNTHVYTRIYTQAHINKQQQRWNLWGFLSWFFFFFNMDHFFKAFIEMVTISLLFYVLVFGPIACGIIAPWQGIEPTPTPSIGRWRLNHWDHQGSPWNFCLENTFFQSNQGLQRGNFA